MTWSFFDSQGRLKTVGSGAPVDSLYLVLAPDGTLTNHRRFVDGSGLGAVDGGAGGDYTLSVNVDGTTIEIAADTLQVVAGVFAAASHTHVEADITDLLHDAVQIQGRAVASTLPTDGQALVWSDANSRWEPGTLSGGSGTFLGLTDTPAAFTGAGGQAVLVNSGETALEFADVFVQGASGELVIAANGAVATIDAVNSFTGTMEYLTTYHSAAESQIRLRRSRGTQASPLKVASGDNAGTLYFDGKSIDGISTWSSVAMLQAKTGTPAGGNIPGQLWFKTGRSDSSSLFTALVIDANQNVEIGSSGSPATRLDVAGAITLHELSADPSSPAEGASVEWQSDGTGTGSDGDRYIKTTAGAVTKTIQLTDHANGVLAVKSLQGRTVSASAPSDGDVLTFNNTAGEWQPAAPTGGSGSAYNEACLVYHSADQSLANGATTTLAFNSEYFDTNSLHNTATNNSRLTAQVAGFYDIKGYFRLSETGVTGTIETRIVVNGTTTISESRDFPSGASYPFFSIVGYVYLNASDYVELTVYQSTGGSKTAQRVADYSVILGMAKVAE